MPEYQPQNHEREISPEELASNVSLFMTKPENTDTRAPLLLFLKANNLNAKPFRVVLSQEILNTIYRGIQNSPELMQATNDHLLGKESEIFLVTRDAGNDSGNSVLDQVVKLVGAKTNPEDNMGGTLRKHFHGETKIYSDSSGKDVLYFENGFHRPTTSRELVEQLNALGLLEEAKRLAK